MRHDLRNVELAKEEQKRMFRIALDPLRYGLTLKAIAIDSGLGYDALRTWARGEAIMSLTAIRQLCGVIPDDLISLLLPGEFFVQRKSDGLDFVAMAARSVDYLATYSAARSEESEDGAALGPRETDNLSDKLARLKS